MLTTWHDATLHCLRNVGLDASDGLSLSRAKQCIQDGVNLTNAARQWVNSSSLTRIITSAEYVTGTVAYTAATRSLTLSGGTWPAWAAYGTVLIDAVPYSVERRVSDTVLTLKADREPGVNVASGTSYTLFRDQYALPRNFGALIQHYRLNVWQVCYVSQELFLQLQETREVSGQPRYFAIMGDSHQPDLFAMYFYPAPTAAESIDLRYKRRPVALRNFDVSTGTVSVTSGGATVTGVGTSFTSALVGAVIRFGTTATVPEDAYSNDAAFTHEARILSVESTTSLTLDAPAEQTSAAVKYRISDGLECGDGGMRSAVLAACLWQFEERRGSPDRTSKAYQNYQTLLQSAARMDQLHVGTGNGTPLSPLQSIVPTALAHMQHGG